MIGFVILHYMIIEETIKCIESIKNKVIGRKKIVVVDNASSNFSGKYLKDYYFSDDEVDVIINKYNMGFAKANNIGVDYLKSNFPSEFYIVSNNDIEIITDNFYYKLCKCYSDTKFDIMGPSIYSSSQKYYQNPKRTKLYTYEEVKKLNKYYFNNKEKNNALVLKSILKSNKLINSLIMKYKFKNNIYKNNKILKNVILHGSFIVFSKSYIENNKYAFNPNTFFYWESEILSYEAISNGYNTIYYPEIDIVHHQNVSTNVVYKNLLDKALFANQNNYKSTNILLEIMKKHKEL